ncbi:helix-turn-helix transcriptional regulator [Ureibacillus chungkukjangi]|uniref:PadR family transcriptional regulator n=1 Tax=Ureibacillus chungkukjangi TaxID=1202712 RepID=UPI00203D89E5|nr:helix-turn-helix transcriptional regulator [Ureibacillus chungkukjangi]MCM3387125.1 helix-turn-helix transcriptional regulator [Ureibacillus chungkukjangi]
MSIQVYILSKLMEGDNYPYKLKKELSDPIPFDKMGNLTESKLYYHFESLTKQGLVKPIEVIKEENRPDKQLFAITDKGREMLPLKIYELFEKAKNLSEILIGIMFLRFVDQSRIIQILQRKIEGLKSKQSQVQAIYNQIPIEESKKVMIDFAENYYSNTISNEIIWLETLISKLNANNN